MGQANRKFRSTSSSGESFDQLEQAFTINGHATKINGASFETPPQYHAGNRPRLTEAQVTCVLETWEFLKTHLSKVGIVFFLGLFETHPDVRDAFLPFRDLTDDDLRNSEILRAHGLRVMRIVEKSLGRIHEPQKLESLLHELGKKHVGYNAKSNYIDLMGPQFIAAIKPALEGHWNTDVEEAWTALFQYIAHIMKEGMYMAQAT